MPIVQTGSASTEVAQVGRGSDLLMLHSLLTDRSAYDRILPALARNHRVTLVSLPGFGASSPVEAGIWSYADRIADVFRELSLPPDTGVLGNGFGGFVAAAFAARYGDLCNRVILAGTGIRFPEPGREAFRQMAARVSQEGMEAIVETAVRRLFTEEYIEANPSLVDACRSVLLRADPDAFVTACNTLVMLDLSDALDELTNPTLVLVGQHDAATPPAMGRAFAEAVQTARYVEMQDVAHAPQIQSPEEFLRQVEAFLDW